jgi:hypothetical protein
MKFAVKDLKLKSLDLIHSGDNTFYLADNVRAVSSKSLLENLKPIF